MSGLAMMTHMLLERLSRRELPRVPESDLVMDAPEQVGAFAESGQVHGPLAPIYLFLAVHGSTAIQPGGTVLDLACGPCNQLIQLARLHPDTHFIGVDVAPNMLKEAERNLARSGVRNVSVRLADVRELTCLDTASVDGVVCTLSLHHLPHTDALQETMRAARRVLKPGGGVFLADFGRLKRLSTLHFLVKDRQAEQSPQFTADFMNSMRAAFSVAELREAAHMLGPDVLTYRTVLAPFMMLLRREVLAAPRQSAIDAARAQFMALSPSHQRDFLALSNWFKAAGLPMPFPIKAG